MPFGQALSRHSFTALEEPRQSKVQQLHLPELLWLLRQQFLKVPVPIQAFNRISYLHQRANQGSKKVHPSSWAGAIDFFGPRYGLPNAISAHQNYYFWGPRQYTGESLILLQWRGRSGLVPRRAGWANTRSAIRDGGRALHDPDLPRAQRAACTGLAEAKGVELVELVLKLAVSGRLPILRLLWMKAFVRRAGRAL